MGLLVSETLDIPRPVNRDGYNEKETNFLKTTSLSHCSSFTSLHVSIYDTEEDCETMKLNEPKRRKLHRQILSKLSARARFSACLLDFLYLRWNVCPLECASACLGVCSRVSCLRASLSS